MAARHERADKAAAGGHAALGDRRRHPTLWTPEQALAVFELLDDLSEKIWTLYGCQIQALLKQEQRHGDAGARGSGDPSDDRSF